MEEIDIVAVAEDVEYFPEDSFVQLIFVNLKEYAESKFETLSDKPLLERDILTALYKNYEELPEEILKEAERFASYVTTYVPDLDT